MLADASDFEGCSKNMEKAAAAARAKGLFGNPRLVLFFGVCG
jgi:hypothetical protein